MIEQPVVDDINRLKGRITFDDVIDFVREEAEKDYQLAAGITSDVEADDSIWELTKGRLPWLLIGMFGGLGAASIINGFNDAMLKFPMLLIFIPLIQATAGNVGVQSSAIVVQSLARGDKDLGRILPKLIREGSVGLMNGLILSSLIFLVATVFVDIHLGFVVSLSLFTVILFAAIFGTLFPMILNRYKIDPALAIGPFVTTLNDVIGIFIYFSIGLLLM